LKTISLTTWIVFKTTKRKKRFVFSFQGVKNELRKYNKTPEDKAQMQQEEQRMVPEHTFINRDLLESVHYISSLFFCIREVLLSGGDDNTHNQKNRSFRRQWEKRQKREFLGIYFFLSFFFFFSDRMETTFKCTVMQRNLNRILWSNFVSNLSVNFCFVRKFILFFHYQFQQKL
jgi:hypothetical protein